MSPKIKNIITAKSDAGEAAFLWLQDDAGDCILWSSENESQNDDGYAAIGRWNLSEEEVEELCETGEVDEHN